MLLVSRAFTNLAIQAVTTVCLASSFHFRLHLLLVCWWPSSDKITSAGYTKAVGLLELLVVRECYSRLKTS